MEVTEANDYCNNHEPAEGHSHERKNIGLVFASEIEVNIQDGVSSSVSDSVSNSSSTGSRKLILFALCMINLTLFMALAMMAPFFPRVASDKGVSTTVSGLIFSVYSIVMMISFPFLGKAIPRTGVRLMLLTGIVIAGTGNVLFGLIGMVNGSVLFTVLCFLIRTMSAFGAACFITSSSTFLIRKFTDNLGIAYGIIEAFIGLGVSIGPPIGGFLYEFGGYGLPFYTIGVFILLNFPVCFYLIKETENHQEEPTTSLTYRQMLKSPKVLVVTLVLVWISSCLAFLDPTLEPHLRQYNLSAVKLGLLFLAGSGTYSLLAPLSGWLAGMVKNVTPFFVIGLLINTFGYSLLGPSDAMTSLGFVESVWLNTVAMFFLGVSFAIGFIPTFQSLLNAVIGLGVPDNLATHGLVSGWWSCANCLGEGIGTGLGGVLVDHFGFVKTVDVIVTATLAVTLVVVVSFIVEVAAIKSSPDANVLLTNEIVESGTYITRSARLQPY